MSVYVLPSDKELLKTKAVFSSYFFKWSSEKNLITAKKYGFKTLKKPLEGTFRNYVGIDEKINRIHQYIKLLKFGYGRGTDHSNKDIRDGYITRKQGVKNVLKYDHAVPKDLSFFCKYVGISKDEFFYKADKFRNKNSWWIEDRKWFKNCIDGKVRSYGETTFNNKEINNFNKK